MLKTFEEIKKNVRFKPKIYSIDNIAFKLHYRVTTLIFLVATTLVTSQQYIGEHIKCIADDGVASNVLNTFCFFTTTFTVAKNSSRIFNPYLQAHPGVGPLDPDTDSTVFHAYYQWVPFVLFGQAIMFYFTHLWWKAAEKHTMSNLINGFEFAAYRHNKEMQSIHKDKKIPTKRAIADKVDILAETYLKRQQFNKAWAYKLISIEVINFLNVFFQVYITNAFLQNKFLSLGVEVFHKGLDNEISILDYVFPKITKCDFHKYGPSGAIQKLDVMCVMALNIVNEKIYVFLWFWFLILLVVSVLALLWRVVSYCLHNRSNRFNRIAFGSVGSRWQSFQLTKESRFGDWLFLNYLGSNLDSIIFTELLKSIAEKLEIKYDVAMMYAVPSKADKKPSSFLEKVTLLENV